MVHGQGLSWQSAEVGASTRAEEESLRRATVSKLLGEAEKAKGQGLGIVSGLQPSSSASDRNRLRFATLLKRLRPNKSYNRSSVIDAKSFDPVM